MNNPFNYEPSEEMLALQKQLVAHIEMLCNEDSAFGEEVAKGKMFGILRTKSETLFAFSGQIGGLFDWPGFVPAVFDYLDKDGYFKVHEREISAINNEIRDLESASDFTVAKEEYARLKEESEKDIEHYRQMMKAAKAERDLIRGKGLTDEVSLIRESQFMKAELHRKKLLWKEKLDASDAKINGFIGKIRSLKLQRQRKSDALQRWLFEQFWFTNPNKPTEKKNLIEIFDSYNREHNLLRNQSFDTSVPPSGSGECCEPKLLHYATEHGLEPIEIGMVWWGESPKQEIRHHGQFYPACNGKCRPILEFLGISQEDKDEAQNEQELLEEIYSDSSLVVVSKPSGMLSVPGRTTKPSVFSILKEKYADCEELQMVHRLDMDTSGLLVVAKTKEAHKNLQRQFAEHTIKKEYIAVLSGPVDKKEGIISLPLRPDFDDRPRQIVDYDNGKEAITQFEVLEEPLLKREGTVVRLWPHTGRTHQLRVHCAHKEGLGNPIKGDRLYGRKSDRLYLHAASIEFTHPESGEQIHFVSQPKGVMGEVAWISDLTNNTKQE